MLNSCRDNEDPCQDPRNPECENYNPCLDAKQVSARFHIYEYSQFHSLDPNWVNYDTDTSVMSGIVFNALETNAQSYTWYIGNETQPRSGPSVTIDFSNNRTPKRIRLIVHKEPNLRCFPNDDGIDTVDRMLYFVNYLDTANIPVLGTFKGVSNRNPNQEMTIKIGFHKWASGSSYHRFISGLNGCKAYNSSGILGFRLFTPWEVNMRSFLPNGELTPPCTLFNVICRSPENTDSIYVQYKPDGRDSALYLFKGVKI
jgi:hypothetical protein